MKIYIVLHHEIMGPPWNLRADEMVFWTTSSMKKARGLIRNSGVDDWSWWEIQVQDLDSEEWPEHVAYYNNKGRKIDVPPYDKACKIFARKRRDEFRCYLNSK